MKVAFHFNADDTCLGGYYGYSIRKDVFKIILKSRTIDLHTKIFQGDLLLHSHTMDIEKTKTGEVHRFNPDKFISAINSLLNPETHIWRSFSEYNLYFLIKNNVFVLFFESISFRDAQEIDNALKKITYYIGAIEVDERNAIHWVAYSGSLISSYRIIGKSIYILWDGINEDDKDRGEINELQEIGFEKVELESLNGKFTIFDKFHDFDHARRVAEIHYALSDSLAFMVDQCISRISDSAPEIGNKIWSALRTYDRAEVSEDFAQVAVTCRRIIEYVSDQLFPPQEERINDRKMGKNNYRNRLLAFADKERKSDTNIDLVCVSTKSLAEQLEKLSNLSNKGVHANMLKHEARRCLLRTITILDDIISLKTSAFQHKNHFDSDMLNDMLKA